MNAPLPTKAVMASDRDPTSRDDTASLPFVLEAEDGWMVVEVAETEGNTHRRTLTVRGVHGARGGKYEQQVDLTRDQRVAIATALLDGTSKCVSDRGDR